MRDRSEIIIGVREYQALESIERCGAALVAHGSLPAQHGRGGYPVMVYLDGELANWQRQFSLDRLWVMGVLELLILWESVSRDWDCLYTRTWRRPLKASTRRDKKVLGCNTFIWDYELTSAEEKLRFALESKRAYNAVQDVSAVAASARDYAT